MNELEKPAEAEATAITEKEVAARIATSIPTTLTRRNVFLHESAYIEEAMHGFCVEAASTPYNHALAVFNAACGLNSAPYPAFSSLLSSARVVNSHVLPDGNPVHTDFLSPTLDVQNYMLRVAEAFLQVSTSIKSLAECLTADNELAQKLDSELDDTAEDELRTLTSPDADFLEPQLQLDALASLGGCLAAAQGIAVAARQVTGLRSSVFDTASLLHSAKIFPEIGLMFKQVGAEFRASNEDVRRHAKRERTAGLLLAVIARDARVCRSMLDFVYGHAYEDFLLRQFEPKEGSASHKVEIDNGLINMRVNGVFLREQLSCNANVNLDDVTLDEESLRMVERALLGVFAQHFSEVLDIFLRESFERRASGSENMNPDAEQNLMNAIFAVADPYVDLSIENEYTLPMLSVLDRMTGGSAVIAKNQLSSSADYHKRMVQVLLDDTGEEMLDLAISFDMP